MSKTIEWLKTTFFGGPKMKLTIANPIDSYLNATIKDKGTYYIDRVGFVTRLYGESQEDAQKLAVRNMSVSRRHLQINIDNIDDKVTLIDLGSKFGSYINGELFEKAEILEPCKCQLRLGQLELELEYQR